MMNWNGMIGVIFFLGIRLMTWVSLRWLWVLICEAADVTRDQIKDFRRENIQSSNLQKSFYIWMINNSSNPKRFKRLYWTYQALCLPSLLFASLSLISCFTHTFDKIVGYGAIFMPSMIIVLAIVGTFNSALGNNKRRLR